MKVITFRDEYHNGMKFEELTADSDNQFMTLNQMRPLSDKTIRNDKGVVMFCNDNFYMNNFLYESDDCSLEQQKAVVRKLWNMHIPYCVTFSGNKSLHIIIKTNYEGFDTAVYKRLWKELKNKYLPEVSCDTAVTNPSRLCRKPNGTRSNGKKQLLICHNEANVIDVSDILQQIEAEVAEEKKKQTMLLFFKQLKEAMYPSKHDWHNLPAVKSVLSGDEYYKGNRDNSVYKACYSMKQNGYRDEICDFLEEAQLDSEIYDKFSRQFNCWKK